MSFVGGGTDVASFYREHGGAVISAAIDKYVYVTVNGKFDGQVRVSYSRTENVACAGEVEHPIACAALLRTYVESGVEITSVADVPSHGTGLGSSSAYCVGLLNALHVYRGHDRGPMALAEEACAIEIEDLREPIGKQDQFACAFGGVNFLRFNANGLVDVRPLMMPPSIQRTLMLFYVGGGRAASTVLTAQQERSTANVKGLKAMLRLVDWLRRDFSAIGPVMHEAWMIKRTLAPGISTDEIDGMYSLARAAGATGGKILGAGGSGFLLLCAPLDRHEAICQSLSSLRRVPFSFDFIGSRIVYREEGSCGYSSRAEPGSSAATSATG
jgi:D-glycero-alpha-D-manno-heptose-7-phosphate kinase